VYRIKKQVPVSIKQLASRQNTPFVIFFISLTSCIVFCLVSSDKECIQ